MSSVAELHVPLNGMIDTGASVVVVDRRFALQLNLAPRNRKDLQMADGSETRATVYAGRLMIPELEFDDWVEVYGVLMDRPSNRVLLGRSFLRRYFVTYEGPTETFKFYEAQQRPTRGYFEEHDE